MKETRCIVIDHDRDAGGVLEVDIAMQRKRSLVVCIRENLKALAKIPERLIDPGFTSVELTVPQQTSVSVENTCWYLITSMIKRMNANAINLR